MGSEGFPPCPGNNGNLHVILTSSKAQSRANQIPNVANSQRIGLVELGGAIGGMSLHRASLVGEFARSAIRPLYEKLYDPLYRADLATTEIDIPKWWVESLKFHAPKRAHPHADRSHFAIYTDASTRDHRISAILFEVQNTDRPIVSEICAGRIPKLRNR